MSVGKTRSIRYNVSSGMLSSGRARQAVSEKQTRFIREVIETITLTLLVLLMIHSIVQSFRIDGPSMEPTFATNQDVLVNKTAYLLHPPQRGDIIAFRYPLDIHESFIKRVIGIPGDTIQITHTAVRINGTLLHEPYASTNVDTYEQTWTLGQGQFFVMGDNRENSLDSRSWGPLEQSYIIGKVLAVYWPLPNWHFVNTYPAVYTAVHPGK